MIPNAEKPVQVLAHFARLAKERQSVNVQDTRRGQGYLAFKVGAENYLLSMDDVLEVVEELDITPLPFSEPWLLGLSNFRGNIYSVTDFLLYTEQKIGKVKRLNKKYIILREAGEGYALLVDEVAGIRWFSITVEAENYGWVEAIITERSVRWKLINVAALIEDRKFNHVVGS